MADWEHPENYRKDGRPKPLKWEVRKRLEFIEFMLYWGETLTAEHICQYFEVARAQAFEDINHYRTLTVPRGASGDVCNVKSRPQGRSKMGVEPADEMTCRFIVPSFDDYMKFFMDPSRPNWVSSVSKQYIPDKLAIERVETLSRRNIDPACARKVIRAIRRGLTLEVDYLSPSYTEPQTISITPICLGDDGFRWHTRAYRHDLGAYRDLVLERIVKVRDFLESDRVPKDPGGKPILVEIEPNPALSAHEQANIAAQYPEMEGRVWNDTMNMRMVPYFLKRYQLEEKSIRKAPHQEPLALRNREAVTKFLDAGWRVPLGHESDPIEPLLKKIRARQPNPSDVDIVVEALKKLAK